VNEENIITRSVSFHMGHRVPNHKSKCRNIHGHGYKVTIGVKGNINQESGKSEEGMVIDFGDLKDILHDTIYNLCDHAFMIYDGDILWKVTDFKHFCKTENMKIVIVHFIPTAENMAKYFYEIVSNELAIKSINKIELSYVIVQETEHSTATYTRKEGHKHEWEIFCNTLGCISKNCNIHLGRKCKMCGIDKL